MQTQRGSEESDRGIVCVRPHKWRRAIRSDRSNDSLEGRRTTAVGWFVQRVHKLLRINSSATPLDSESIAKEFWQRMALAPINQNQSSFASEVRPTSFSRALERDIRYESRAEKQTRFQRNLDSRQSSHLLRSITGRDKDMKYGMKEGESSAH
ncbi:hypothetical protein AVEN_114411-1 [Araneus ventricosus]|uniref:Uncharacterized protein n=1 Tax=Araneus ventricosus TaxID=182803 RepID=A0A4Y2S394_ARAVE|nr:hypothetical protein AVEN_114411-1 [Araneus ventricosus]